MGHELVYCATCGNQLRGEDFSSGRAFEVNEQSYCAACASSLPPVPAEPAPPPPETKLRTGPLPRAETTRLSATRVTRALPRDSTTRLPAPKKKGALLPILCGVGAAAALVGVLALVLAGGGKEPLRETEAKPAVKPATEVAKTGAAPVSAVVEKKDVPEALRKAREIRQSRPADVAAHILEYRRALMALDGTPFYADARKELDAIVAELEKEAAALDQEIAGPLARDDYAAALKALEAARQKRDIPEWTLLVDKRMDDVYRRRKAAGLAPPAETAKAPSPAAPKPAAPKPEAPKPAPVKPEPPKDPKEIAARELLDAADREFADVQTYGKAIEKYKILLNEYPTIEFVRQSMKLILRRSEAGKEFLLSPAETSAAGTFKRAKDEKAGDCWRSSADSDPERGAKNYVDAEFYALPSTEYKAWAYAGACCAEKFSIDIQATDLTFTDPKSKKTYQLDPGGGAALPVPQKASFPRKTHAQHDPKKPDPHTWHWVSLPIPKYAASGAKKIRLVTDREALSIAWVLVTSTRAAPPADAEMKEMAKERAAEPAAAKPKPAAGGLLVHLKFDEGKGASAADASGKGKHGAVQGSAGWGAGKLSGAISLDGKDDSVKLDPAGLDVDQGSFSVSVWANSKESKHVRLANKWDGSGKKGWLFDLHGARGGGAKVGNVRFAVGDGAKTVDVSLGADLPTGQWLHLAAVVDRGKSELLVYVNGSPVGGAQSLADLKGSCASAAALYVGSLGAGGFFSGLVDDFRLYNKALSGAEVKSLASGK